MASGPNRFLNFLDQLLPFLSASPPGLRLWIYALILMNLVTVAVVAISYLYSKETTMEEQSLKHFSIEWPTNNQEIPLGDNGTFLLAGTLPKIKDADFDVRVSKVPERQSIPQTGEKTLSTFDGRWRYDSAKFTGSGSYEIEVLGHVGDDKRAVYVTVTCYDKAPGYQRSIEREKKFRAFTGGISLPVGDPKEQFLTLDQEFRAAYLDQNDLQRSLLIVNQGLDLLDAVLPLWPNDLDLQNGRAYFLKNYFMVTRDLHRPEPKALDEAKLMFEAIREQEPADPSAWNGLGNVFALSEQPQVALQFIDKALSLAHQQGKEYPDASRDRQVVLQMIEQQQRAGK